MSTLFLHPIGLDGKVWDGIAGPNDLALDLPGFGTAPPLPGPLSLAGLADHVAGIIAMTEADAVDVVGMSLGSMVAQHLAIRHPDLVRSLLLCAAGARSNPEAAKQRAELTRSGGMAGVLSSTLTRWFTSDALRGLHHPGVVYVRDRLLRDDPETFASYWEAMGPHDSTDGLASISVPVSIVAAGNDRSTPVENMRRMADAISGATFTVIDGPHLLHLERPDAFREAIAVLTARRS